MDWTHNTNNLGFYLGALMATTATGMGVPVMEFLCLSQEMSMMRTVLEHFIEHNDGVRDKVRSFVIDKDYKEWRVLQELFPGATIVLCQFHVIKWFKRVITKKKYGVVAASRPAVRDLFRAMVYAETRVDFD